MKINIYRLFLSFIVLSLLSGNAYGQLNPGVWGGGYMPVHSYNGATFSEYFTLQIGYKNVNIKNWAVTFRINGPIINNEGKIIPSDKVKIKINTISGSSAPTFSQLGVVTTPIPLSLANQAIIPNSHWALHEFSNSHKSLLLTFDIIIEGGGYLQALKSSSPYPLNLVFSINEGNEKLYESVPISALIMIEPQGTPPAEPVYSIQLNNGANNGLLVFESISDYLKGVSQTFPNGLSIISDTPYALRVKAQDLTNEFSNNSIPISTVSVELKAADNSSVAGSHTLSDAADQSILNNVRNSSTQARFFHIRYFTSPNDPHLQNAKPDTYSTTLIYTMIPQ